MKPNNKTIIAILHSTMGLVQPAAKKLGVTSKTLYNWLDKSAELRKTRRILDEDLLDFTESQLYKNIKEGDNASIFFHLKCKGKHRGWVEKQIIEHQGEIEITVKYDDKN